MKGTPGAPVRVLGVDPGSQATGYGIIEVRGGQARALSHGTVRPPAGEPLAGRLLRIRNRLRELIAESGVSEVAVESLFLGKNPRSAHVLAQVRGAVLLAAAESGCEVFEYAPSRVKQAVTGYGRAEKDQVRAMLGMLLSLGREPRSRDASDALATALCHASFRSGLAPAAARAPAARSRR
jgi:crossover junction endodeoxyribonuclease RuvC